MKICRLCLTKLRKDNTIGMCRAHRNLSDSRKAYIKEYAKQNPDKVRKAKIKHRPKAYAHYKLRRNSDSMFKLQSALRIRLNKALKKGYKAGSAVELLGCSISEFKNYLESKFLPGMTWKNHGNKGWHIDHIIPLSSVDLHDEVELKKVCHFTNLQPLWALDNLRKSNRI